jgi:hypothetical protein
MSQQADPASMPSDLGNIDNYVFGYRYMPIMNSRAGFAFHNEYSWIRQRGTGPTDPALPPGTLTDITGNSIMAGFDFDF